ncbi:DUF1835 domain-containing protein [Flavisolibacter ginsengisoli]|jgi:hypothetical protein|uniref:DUF1835 domain-containing protein n=1 Tax=Flavisolibacter ginsengisoli DSM 18119 TaxID=1121884 RepID=A0A1M4Z152_9BACT|nr:DUF1835 domain-containing protein [Flavisolibacter ginsengisoli]SHF11710.1 Protein of unknown function [Flavisolibacter ginsengisoli DSM 18119]
MIHIVFQQQDIEVLKKAIELDESLSGRVEIIRDDYAVGPIADIYEAEGYQQRRDWWKGLLELSPYNTEQLTEMVDDRLAVHNLKRELEENVKEEVWIWMGQNQHDVCGYYWLISQLQSFQGRVVILYLNNLPFINEKGNIFYPTSLHEIQPKEFLKAKKLNRKVTPSEFEVDPDEWKKLCSENDMVRMLEGGKKIAGKKEDFYDAEILKGLTNEWQKGNKAMSGILGKMKIKTGDVFLLWRMKKMAEEDKMEIHGDTNKGWKDFEVRLKNNTVEEVSLETK